MATQFLGKSGRNPFSCAKFKTRSCNQCRVCRCYWIHCCSSCCMRHFVCCCCCYGLVQTWSLRYTRKIQKIHQICHCTVENAGFGVPFYFGKSKIQKNSCPWAPRTPHPPSGVDNKGGKRQKILWLFVLLNILMSWVKYLIRPHPHN